METPLKRINKYLSELGFCSRREADRLVEAGRVTIDGAVVKMGTKVAGDAVVCVDGKTVKCSKTALVYLAFNKPVGIVCTTDTRVERDNIIDFVKYPKRIFPVGRLDKQSEGLIFLTNDGDIVNKILRSSNNHEKEYVVKVDKPISQTFVERMSNGIPLEELHKITKRCRVEKINSNEFSIVLTQGLNRQIRRMCAYLNYNVVALKRVRIMNVALDVPIGTYRHLTPQELDEMRALIHSRSMQKH